MLSVSPLPSGTLSSLLIQQNFHDSVCKHMVDGRFDDTTRRAKEKGIGSGIARVAGSC